VALAERLKVVAAALVAVTLMLVVVPVGAPTGMGNSLVVKATIWPNLVITFSPTKFNRGTVRLQVKNRTSAAHEFMINGVTWHWIKPHTASSNSVTFKRRGVYQATLPDCGYLSMCAPTARDSGPVGLVRVR